MSRSLVVSSPDSPRSDGSMAAIGTRSDILGRLRRLNTGPQAPGEDVLYGPGIELEFPPGQDPVTQMLLRINDEDLAWDVIAAISRATHWKLLDPNTGRELRL
jgi:hypothetical protein